MTDFPKAEKAVAQFTWARHTGATPWADPRTFSKSSIARSSGVPLTGTPTDLEYIDDPS